MLPARARFILLSTCLLPFAALAQTPPPQPTPTIIPAPPAGTTAVPAAAPAATPLPVPAAAPVSTPPAATGTPVTREELPALIKEALINDPDILMQAIQKMREKQQAESGQKAQAAIAKYKDDLYNNPISPATGDAATADITIVEFFDYHCGYCKQLLTSFAQLLKEDKKVRVIFKEFPILSDDSVKASRASLAFNKLAPAKYFDFHNELMKHDGNFDDAFIFKTAKQFGVSEDKLKAEMASGDITAELDKNRKIAEDLGIRGTPVLIMGNEIVPGALSYDELKKAVEAMRGMRGTGGTLAAPPAAPAGR